MVACPQNILPVVLTGRRTAWPTTRRSRRAPDAGRDTWSERGRCVRLDGRSAARDTRAHSHFSRGLTSPDFPAATPTTPPTHSTSAPCTLLTCILITFRSFTDIAIFARFSFPLHLCNRDENEDRSSSSPVVADALWWMTERKEETDRVKFHHSAVRRQTGPDYGISIVGKYPGPTTSKGLTKDGCKMFWTYVSQSITYVLCSVSTKLPIFALKRKFHVITRQYCIWPDWNTQRKMFLRNSVIGEKRSGLRLYIA